MLLLAMFDDRSRFTVGLLIVAAELLFIATFVFELLFELSFVDKLLLLSKNLWNRLVAAPVNAWLPCEPGELVVELVTKPVCEFAVD
jgi:hypothetical protein